MEREEVKKEIKRLIAFEKDRKDKSYKLFQEEKESEYVRNNHFTDWCESSYSIMVLERLAFRLDIELESEEEDEQ